MTSFRFLLIVLLMLFACSHIASADNWRVPLAGNSFPRSSAGRLPVGRDGTVQLSDPAKVVSVYFRVNRPAQLQLSLDAQSMSESTSVQAVVSDGVKLKETFAFEITRSDKLVREHAFTAASAGYIRVDLSATAKDSAVRVNNLLISSDTQNLELAFVKSNEGNMFYWGRRGPSVHLRYGVPKKQPLRYAYSELMIPEGQDPIGSYFMANGFGEGYFGIQVNSPTERRVLFSVWSPFKTDNPKEIPEEQRIVALGRGEGVRIGEFGNEGSGGQSFLVYPWEAGKTYRFLTEVEPDGKGNTKYSCWFGEAPKESRAGTWRLIASFRRPQTDTNLRGFHSFLENFVPSTGNVERLVRYRNVWVCDVKGEWHQCTDARFSVDATGGGGHRLDFTGGAEADYFYLKNCGFFNGTGKPGETFTRESSGSEPPEIDFDQLPRG